jgi:hypothetical protein
MQLGNTTWNLSNVYFDVPAPNGEATWDINTQPLTSHQQATLPKGVTVVKGRPRPYRVPRGTAIVRPKLHVAIDGPTVAHSGGSATYRIRLSRGLFKKKLVYRVKDVRVLATQAGHRVGLWRLGTLNPGRTRTRQAKLKVPKARANVCLRVTAKAKQAATGSAVTCAAVGRLPLSGRG